MVVRVPYPHSQVDGLRVSPTRVLWLGMVVSLWYLALIVMIQMYSDPEDRDYGLSIVLAALSLLTISGCIYRLRKRVTDRN